MDERTVGRPRLTTPERRRRILASKAKWRDENREYYRAQKRAIAQCPESKARRKELREQRRVVPPTRDETTLWNWYDAHIQNASSRPEVASQGDPPGMPS